MTLSPSEKEQYRKTLHPENLKNTTMIVWETSGQVPEGISLKK
jgi:D-serine dehydratase